MNSPAEQPVARDRDWYLDHLANDLERFANAVRPGDLAARVAGCPDWDLRQLAAHMGAVHRWAAHCAAHAAPPEPSETFEPAGDLDAAELADWLTAGGANLMETLAGIDLDAPTWHPFPVPRVGRVWPRRQAQEISIHRWDAEHAAGVTPAAIDPALASDGIDEYFEIVIPRLVKRAGAMLPSGSLHVHCTDTDGEWMAWHDPTADTPGGLRIERAHRKGDAAVRGPAEVILLQLWGRPSGRADELSPVGDEAVLDTWMAITGL